MVIIGLSQYIYNQYLSIYMDDKCKFYVHLITPNKVLPSFSKHMYAGALSQKWNSLAPWGGVGRSPLVPLQLNWCQNPRSTLWSNLKRPVEVGSIQVTRWNSHGSRGTYRHAKKHKPSQLTLPRLPPHRRLATQEKSDGGEPMRGQPTMDSVSWPNTCRKQHH